MDINKTKHFLKYTELLDKEIVKNTELFFSQRPFLLEPTKEPIISDTNQEEVELNEIAIVELVKKIKKSV